MLTFKIILCLFQIQLRYFCCKSNTLFTFSHHCVIINQAKSQRSDTIRTKGKSVIPVCVFGFVSNLTLFLIKLYVGLSCNSISIYSDGINNMFDGLSVLLTALCLGFFGKNLLLGTKSTFRKTEELLSLVLNTLYKLSNNTYA